MPAWWDWHSFWINIAASIFWSPIWALIAYVVVRFQFRRKTVYQREPEILTWDDPAFGLTQTLAYVPKSRRTWRIRWQRRREGD